MLLNTNDFLRQKLTEKEKKIKKNSFWRFFESLSVIKIEQSKNFYSIMKQEQRLIYY
jgi:hypothetical protein